jgi:hypothetical protein
MREIRKSIWFDVPDAEDYRIDRDTLEEIQEEMARKDRLGYYVPLEDIEATILALDNLDFIKL